jgi:hypothetical protein
VSSITNRPARHSETSSAQKLAFPIPNEVAIKTELSVSVISDPFKVLELKKDVDAFVSEWSRNPFLFSGFLSQFMRSNRLAGWAPFLFVVKADEKIVGTAPLMVKKKLGMHFARFFPNFWFSPDFVVNEQYRNAFMTCLVDYLVKYINCRFACFAMPVFSQNLKTLEQYSKVNRISFSAKNQSGHCVLPVECSWGEFQEKKGRRRIVRQIERKLNQIGPWKIDYVENVCNRPDVLKKILGVERNSWKDSWRNKMQIVSDEDLLMIWEGSQIIAETKPDFKGCVWFLQINHEIVAYTFIIKYKGTAFITKTSYDNKYRKFYIGKYLMNTAIRDLFNEGKTKAIDFMTDLPFMTFWNPLSLPRVDVDMSKGNLAKFVQSLNSNTYVPQVLKDILCKFAL